MIGNTTNRQTVEELARSYRLVDRIQERPEKLKRPGAAEKKMEKDVASRKSAPLSATWTNQKNISVCLNRFTP
ncbi:MAG TPA: hypothetical protein ENH29_10215 [Bacteroidetes bacterium]|nr:hypothetical protein [Bacteroidota bacterium]